MNFLIIILSHAVHPFYHNFCFCYRFAVQQRLLQAESGILDPLFMRVKERVHLKQILMDVTYFHLNIFRLDWKGLHQNIEEWLENGYENFT